MEITSIVFRDVLNVLIGLFSMTISMPVPIEELRIARRINDGNSGFTSLCN